MRLWMQPQNEKFFALVSKAGSKVVGVGGSLLLNQAGEPSDDAERARRRQEAVLAKWTAPGMCNPDDETPCVDREPSEDGEHGDARSHGQRNHDALNTVL
ncbi:MAG: hypothetical protein QOF66_4266 [Mycobacterium sp.]|jgi:hypothetical protein|nr:hypothetical protein [Mycobacterium sp.]MDT5055900.1 hypothetical protein [Mycobacterium sp.]